MKKRSVGFAMTILIIGNLVAVLSDALIKTMGKDAAVFQFVFFRQLSAVMILLPFCLHATKQSFLVGLKWHCIRAHVWLLGAIFMVISLNTLPLATANAIFYAAPLIMLPLAVMVYSEKLSRYSIAAGIIGFAGVLVIVRPTDISWAALAALVVAFTIAVNNLFIRKLPTQQSVAQTLLLTNLIGMPASLALALWENKPWDWSPLITASGSSALILVYAATCVVAYRAAESNKIASAEYSGLIGAVIVGYFLFDEVPDVTTLVGTVMIIAPLLWLAKVERKQNKKDSIQAIAVNE